MQLLLINDSQGWGIYNVSSYSNHKAEAVMRMVQERIVALKDEGQNNRFN